MNSKSLRRLAADHGSLHTAGLPPNYLFPPESDSTSDLTSLDILLAGPVGTPYSGGVWRLHLDIPPTYPTAPPTAQFRTRLWHPNIDEATGAVCVETLKRDWSSTLKLRDVLVTISCLLIQPNPASALNEAAGKLATEDWEGYCRRARLMTGIHAAIPSNIEQDVREAQMRGEDKTTIETDQPIPKPHSKGKEKERVKVTPAGPKLQRQKSEDEENRRRRGATQDGDSDTEGDWIPGPGGRTRRSAVPASRRQNNIFGIKGLDDGMQIDSPPKRIFAVPGAHTPYSTSPASTSKEKEKENGDDTDPFTTVTSKRNTHPESATGIGGTVAAEMETETPDLLKFSTQNPFAAIQPNNQTHPLFKEFSYSWEDAMVIHDAGVKADTRGKGKADVRKRHATEEFEKKERWEMKRFKRAGGDLKRFNRGDFGARTGVGRL
ncbi:ubiquitin-conjugating enzyme E2 S [Alternaria rosae]|uniref:ubiquitin-conjugating enzyme E2 S n=1 Tax=Alternaria rosae TaxID=1187941 RepID=UPI001E8D2902|nr:ubiquitin-conjugating enzyme E2 S [Alternaria rosae]KAH6861184.1 ubiquitin-conjugating enzyme E2 S [Alternaria rosae]